MSLFQSRLKGSKLHVDVPFEYLKRNNISIATLFTSSAKTQEFIELVLDDSKASEVLQVSDLEELSIKMAADRKTKGIEVIIEKDPFAVPEEDYEEHGFTREEVIESLSNLFESLPFEMEEDGKPSPTKPSILCFTFNDLTSLIETVRLLPEDLLVKYDLEIYNMNHTLYCFLHGLFGDIDTIRLSEFFDFADVSNRYAAEHGKLILSDLSETHKPPMSKNLLSYLATL